MSPLILSVCRTYTQHKVSSLNAGDSLNTQNEPEEMVRKEKKSEALNIRGSGDLGPTWSAIQAVSLVVLASAFVYLFIGHARRLAGCKADSDPALLPHGCIDPQGNRCQWLENDPCST